MDNYGRKLLDEGIEKLLAELFLKILSVNAGYISALMENFDIPQTEAIKCLENLADKAIQKAEKGFDEQNGELKYRDLFPEYLS